MKTYQKEISQYNGSSIYLILVPVFYEYENKPAWRKVFSGTLEDCKKEYERFPSYLVANHEENRKNREYRRKEAEFLESCGKYKRAASIRKQYKLQEEVA